MDRCCSPPMEWTDRLQDRLFGNATKGKGPHHHGPLQRSSAFRERHDRWLASSERQQLLDELREHLGRERLLGDSPLYLLDLPQATGMEIGRPAWTPGDVLHHLLDEFKDRILDLGYRQQLADLRVGPDGSQQQRYYLKPDIAIDGLGPPLDQRYGNVTLECRGPANAATHLKVLITVYSDRNYSPPLPGPALLSRLLEGN